MKTYLVYARNLKTYLVYENFSEDIFSFRIFFWNTYLVYRKTIEYIFSLRNFFGIHIQSTDLNFLNFWAAAVGGTLTQKRPFKRKNALKTSFFETSIFLTPNTPVRPRGSRLGVSLYTESGANTVALYKQDSRGGMPWAVSQSCACPGRRLNPPAAVCFS